MGAKKRNRETRSGQHVKKPRPPFGKAACACIRNLSSGSTCPLAARGDCATRFLTLVRPAPPRFRDPAFVSVFLRCSSFEPRRRETLSQNLRLSKCWCRREELNLQALAGAGISGRCVYRFATAAWVVRLVPFGGLEPPELLFLREATFPICPEGGKRREADRVLLGRPLALLIFRKCL